MIQPIDGRNEFEGWYRCGYFERELVVSEARNFEGFINVMQGVEFQEDLSAFSIHPPFADTDGSNWWMNNEWNIDPATFRGAIVGLRLKKDLLGLLPVLVLHPALANMVKLKPIKEWQNPLVLVDGNEEICVRFRSWHMNKVGSSIGEENSKLEGCDLIIRPDIFENLVNAIGINYRNIKFIT